MKKIAAATLLLSVSAIGAFADAAAGKVTYEKSCKSCHGTSGTPNPAIAKMMKADMKDLGSSEVQAMSDADIGKTITDGKGKMKPVKTVSGSAVDDVIAYIRTFKK